MLFHCLLHCAIVQNSSKGLETICTWASATSSFKAASHLREQGGSGALPCWQLEGSQLSQELRPAGVNPRELLGSTNRGSHHCSQSLLGLVHPWAQRNSFISALLTLGATLFPALFHTGALATPQMLLVKQAALDVTAGSSVAASDWGILSVPMLDSHC